MTAAPKILLFNGPPRSGKDTSALFVRDSFPRIGFDRFSMPLKRAFAGTVNADIDALGTVLPYEDTKDALIPWLGVSYRQWQIDFSEGFMKPKYGKAIFSRLFCQRVEAFKGRAIVVPDSGFEEEVAPVVERFGEDNVVLFRIHRVGYDFSNDSRSYLRDGLVKRTHDVKNHGTVREFYENLDALVEDALFGTL